MPSTDVYTSNLLVDIDGSPLADDLTTKLLHGRITDAASLPDSFDLEFDDNAGDLLTKAGIAIGKKVKISVKVNGPGQAPVLVEGEVTALEREDIVGSLVTRVRGLDRSHRLFRGRRLRAFIDVTVADVVKKVAQEAGLTAEVSSTPGVHHKISQDNVTDWVFLKRLADRVGYTFSVERGKLTFAKPVEAGDAPSGSVAARSDPVVIEHGTNILYLRSTVTASEQVPEVEVRGWDPVGKQAVSAKKPAKTRSAQLPVEPVKLAKEFASPPYLHPGGQGDQQSQEQLAGAFAERIAGGFAELEAVVLGSASLRSGTAVSVRGFGDPFDGRYVVTESVHEFSAEVGYTTKVHVTNASDRSLYGIATGGASVTGAAATAGSAAFRFPGVLPAIVTKHGDKEFEGLVAVKIPALSDDYESSWARTLQLGAGNAYGWTVLPEVGDEVLVAFEGGDLDRPYVLGGLFNGKDLPLDPWKDLVKNGKVAQRVWTSRTGMVVEFMEDGSKEYVQISSNERAQRITLTQNQDKGIEIISEGPVKVTAKKDATVEAASGAIKLTGKTVEIEATTDLKLKGGSSAEFGAPNVKVKADASAEVSGATVAVKAQGTAELSASGVTTVRGSLVKIN
ncbi:VgrG-related protein [Agromyces sp. LHK192]|uniref:VgrG-related protein n=1 Tax=Agromyces sp. LHK192 TaxID=2498704 RepID=UPI000FD75A6D|nr:VgrG-related protein [Agromyces sp. LHK192]